MKTKKLTVVLEAMLVIALLFGCQGEGLKKPWEGEPESPGSSQAIRITSVKGDFGDITVLFSLAPADWKPRNVRLYYRGACAGSDEWTLAATSGHSTSLAPGWHEIIWNSWDQEAGCKGEVSLRMETNFQGEASEYGPFYLNNTREGQDGFYRPPFLDQGINQEEASTFMRAVDALIQDPTVDFIATRFEDIEDSYAVFSARGSVFFKRIRTNKGYHYEVSVPDEPSGVNPIERQDPTWLATYEEEIAAGSNPNGIALPDLGYPPGDERLSFIEPENDSYPFAYERIAAYFDHPDSADFIINLKSYSHASEEIGGHGSLNVTQSRCPLIFWGAGIRPGTGVGLFAKQVDIAPTVARLLGFKKTKGIDHRGIQSSHVYLGWQDGEVLEDILDGSLSERLIILVADGLSHTELVRQLERNADRLPALSMMARDGAMFEFGSITNFPSVTYPSHNVIGSGMYSGHHGLVDNAYYLRDKQKRAAPIQQLVLTDRYFNPLSSGETLHQAVHRNFGDWKRSNTEGAFTASLLNPSVRGADKADIEFRDQSGEVPFPPLNLPWPPEIPEPDPDMIDYGIVFYEQLLVQMAFVQLYYLFTSALIGVPKYVIINIMATDGAGHVFGPHGDYMGPVLEKVDLTISVLFNWLYQWNLLEGTTIIFTSDHGMQIGDPSRSGSPIDTLKAAGIEIIEGTSLGIYLKVPKVRFDFSILELGKTSEVRVTVTDEDNSQPIPNASVIIDDGLGEQTVLANAEGQAIFAVTPYDNVQVTVLHPEFSVREYTLEVKK